MEKERDEKRVLNESTLIAFLKYAIEETGRISGGHDGFARLSMDNDSYEDIADDFIFRTRNSINNKINGVEWISVKERLPEASKVSPHFSKTVLVTDGCFIGTGFVVYEYGQWTCSTAGYMEFQSNKMIHWANLPIPPLQH